MVVWQCTTNGIIFSPLLFVYMEDQTTQHIPPAPAPIAARLTSWTAVFVDDAIGKVASSRTESAILCLWSILRPSKNWWYRWQRPRHTALVPAEIACVEEWFIDPTNPWQRQVRSLVNRYIHIFQLCALAPSNFYPIQEGLSSSSLFLVLCNQQFSGFSQSQAP